MTVDLMNGGEKSKNTLLCDSSTSTIDDNVTGSNGKTTVTDGFCISHFKGLQCWQHLHVVEIPRGEDDPLRSARIRIDVMLEITLLLVESTFALEPALHRMMGYKFHARTYTSSWHAGEGVVYVQIQHTEYGACV